MTASVTSPSLTFTLFIFVVLLTYGSTTSINVPVPPSSVSNVEEENSEQNNNVGGAEKQECRWGDASCATVNNNSADSSTSNTQREPLFVKVTQHTPPSGFTIDAHVFTNPKTKLAHFDTGEPLVLPYYDCASAGLTSSPIKVTQAYVRHSFTSSPEFYQGNEFDNHPTLLITLSEIEIELNSGESKQLKAGQVVLLEDVVAGGHKLKAADTEATVVFLTLPQSFGGEKFSCHSLEQASSMNVKTKKILLTGIGASLSILLADFLGKVAPIWLSIGIGGMTVIVGGTFGFVKATEQVWDLLELRRFEALLEAEETEEEEEDLDETVESIVGP